MNEYLHALGVRLFVTAILVLADYSVRRLARALRGNAPSSPDVAAGTLPRVGSVVGTPRPVHVSARRYPSRRVGELHRLAARHTTNPPDAEVRIAVRARRTHAQRSRSVNRRRPGTRRS
ncbi:hypothetical protein ACIRRH_31645 [Kitasatospora sp. NPDC101235]|uniref:hypothetical protein n=1 Tax=Kitasatospora sp. NPDC101235 TaxID=3364101 RepID=UPI00380B33EA